MNGPSPIPGDWYVTVTVTRGGGRDPKTGDPVQGSRFELPGCLVGSGTSSDPVDRSDMVGGKAVLTRRDHSFEFRSTDRVTVPSGSWMAGTYMVDGKPAHTPLGWTVLLKVGS